MKNLPTGLQAQVPAVVAGIEPAAADSGDGARLPRGMGRAESHVATTEAADCAGLDVAWRESPLAEG